MYWPQERLVVEVDGFAYHSSRAAFERDRARDARLTQQQRARGFSSR
jgi:very-short-patch-repair endonuclease